MIFIRMIQNIFTNVWYNTYISSGDIITIVDVFLKFHQIIAD